MSRIIYDFLHNSFLIDQKSRIEKYSRFTDAEIRKELDSYRSYVISNLDQLKEEVALSKDKLNAYFGTTFQRKLIDPTLTKAILYFDSIVLDDPLFKLTRNQSEGTEALAKFFEFQSPSQVDRGEIARAAELLHTYQPLVGSDILKIAPISISHEPQSQISISHSDSLFSERVPEELLNWFHERAIVKPVRKLNDGYWGIFENDQLSPCSAIGISFKGYDHPMVFHLTGVQRGKGDRNPDEIKLQHWIPDASPDELHFRAWVTQSINQYAGYLYHFVANDLVSAGLTHSMIMTDSPLLGELLSVQFNEKGTVNEDITSLYFNFDLPFLDNISIHEAINLRQNEGAAFENYRLTMQKELRTLRYIDDAKLLEKKMEDLCHQMAEVQVREIEVSIKRLKQSILADALVGLASLATIIPSQGVSLAALILSGAKLYKKGLYYLHELKGNPAYFIWKTQRKKA